MVFARKASALAKENGMSVKVLDGLAIKKAKMGGHPRGKPRVYTTTEIRPTYLQTPKELN